MAPSGIEPATFRLGAQCLSQMRHLMYVALKVVQNFRHSCQENSKYFARMMNGYPRTVLRRREFCVSTYSKPACAIRMQGTSCLLKNFPLALNGLTHRCNILAL